MIYKLLSLVLAFHLLGLPAKAELRLDSKYKNQITSGMIEQSLNFKQESYIIRLFVAVCVKGQLKMAKTKRALKANGFWHIGTYDGGALLWVHPEGRPAVTVDVNKGRISRCSVIIGKPAHRVNDPVDLLDDLTKEDWMGVKDYRLTPVASFRGM
jgi:hypothetical protein